jgi:hypothetical protein
MTTTIWSGILTELREMGYIVNADHSKTPTTLAICQKDPFTMDYASEYASTAYLTIEEAVSMAKAILESYGDSDATKMWHHEQKPPEV